MISSKNDIAWKLLFDEYNILEQTQDGGLFRLDSVQINKYREARLMTKFDHRSQLPLLFAQNKLSILPISRGGYIIGKLETFHTFEKEGTSSTKIEFPSFLESLNYKEITSESTAINCAFVSRILHHFLEEEELYPTVSGRMSSLTFDFKIKSGSIYKNLEVANSQIEIDGGYEGANSLTLIEAKNYISNDFLIRQLYYPFRLWSDKISKPVRPVFLTYTNGIFHLREYRFEITNDYNSLSLIRENKYAVDTIKINIQNIIDLNDTVRIIEEPRIPFPQADSFARIVNLSELVYDKGFLTKEEITSNYDFDARQTDYYVNSLRYLGLLKIVNDDDGSKHCILTERGISLYKKELRQRQLELVKIILEHKVFNLTLKQYLIEGCTPNKSKVVEIMRTCELYNFDSESVYYRRASTIIGWLNWIINLIEE